MAHAIQSMAYVGQTPWHTLGNQLPPKQSIDVWAQKAGMDWTICEAPVRFMAQEAGAEWYQRGCDIDIRKRPVAAPAATWAVISGSRRRRIA